jgi:hypothetical protein
MKMKKRDARKMVLITSVGAIAHHSLTKKAHSLPADEEKEEEGGIRDDNDDMKKSTTTTTTMKEKEEEGGEKT